MIKRLRNKRLLLIVAIVIASMGLICKIAIWDNPDVLFTVAGGLDVPSASYYIVTERIYQLAHKKNIGEKIKGWLEEGRNEHLHNIYIRTLGVIGEYYSLSALIKAYSKYQHNTSRRSTVICIIDSMGLLGNQDSVPLLETLLRDYDQLDVQASRYAIARALYLITGRRYSFVNRQEEHSKLHLTSELKEARKAIVESMGRKRTFEEMIVLDKIYRPPEGITVVRQN